MKKTFTIFAVILILMLWAYTKFRTASLQVQNQSGITAQKTLHLFAMSDYFPAEVLKDFQIKNNCEVRYDNFASNEELLAKLQAGASGYDVIVPSDYMVRALIASKLIRELDHSKIPNFSHLANDFVNVPYDPGSKFSAPYTWGTTGLIYNKKFVKSSPDSWGILFDKKYAGHISLLDDEREVFGAMLQYLGYSSNTSKDLELKAAQNELIRLKPSVRLFSSDPKQHVLSGDVWIAQMYSGDAKQNMLTDPDLTYFIPKEGGTIWVDTMAIPMKASNPELALSFINYILDPSTAKLITEKLMYSSPNSTLERVLTDPTLKPSYLKKISSRLEFLKDLGAQSEHWDQLWTQAKSN